MERIDELLPGIEVYLSDTLASEKLSPFAEQRRLFFLERLDIVKLPPSVPPREGRNLSQELLKDTEEKSGIPSSQITTTRQQPDFAATQREISRSLRGTGNAVTEERDESHDGDDDSDEEVKVYDDIDIPDDSFQDDTDQRDRRSVDNPYDGDDIDDQDTSSCNIVLNPDDDDDDDENGENDYEIPVAMQQLSDDGGSHPSLAMAESTEEIFDDVIESPVTMGPPPVPPPLPPRRDIRFSDSGSRSSINGPADEAPPNLPFRPSLPRKGEICGRSERSDKSDPDASGDGGSTSYESFDDEDEDPNNCSSKSNRLSHPSNDTVSRNADIKLPAKPSKKKTLKMSRKMPKSKSLSQWEISAPFCKLGNVDVSGELLHKGKLTWNRRLVAITNGCLAMYKPDKDGRPMSVIPLMGYEATVTERKEKGRAFEIKMTHPQDDTHLFSVDVKEWAYAWKEHINNNSRGQRSSAGHTVRLSRALSGDLGIITPGTGTLTQTSNNTGSHGSKQTENFRHSWADEDDYDEVCVRNDNVFFELEERNEQKYDPHNDGIGECSSLISESRSTPASPLTGQIRRAFTLTRSKAFRASIKSTPEERDERKKDNSISSILRRRKLEFQARLGPPLLIGSEILKAPKSTTSLTRLDWKSVLYNWSTPFDQVIMSLRSNTDLNGSNSNLSTGSEGGRQEDVAVRPRLRSGNKVMRMGSFAFRATQFFENISKKTSVKRKQSTQSYTGEGGNTNTLPTSKTTSPKPRGMSLADPEDAAFIGNHNNMRNSSSSHSNILEESSISSNSTSYSPHSPFNSPSSDLNMPVFSDNNSNPSNSPTAITPPGYEHIGHRHGSLTNEVNAVNDHNYLQDVSHKGYLFIFSTFNRRRWGKRWCLVRGNYFECYRSENQPASQCELSFLLKACVLRRAVLETSSELALMLVEVDTHKEKITVEPVTDNEMPAWIQVLMAETSTPSLPEGLEDHMKSIEARRGSDAPSLLSLSVLKQWDMDITLQSMGTSSKGNSSPDDSTSPWLVSDNDTASPVEPLTPTPSDDVNVEESPIFQKESSPLPVADNFVSHNIIKKKHTTDSGFYSVKGNNSDSDGDNVHIINDTETEKSGIDLNCGFSVVESHNFNHSKQCSENNNIHQSNGGGDDSNTALPSPHSFGQTSVNTTGELSLNSPPFSPSSTPSSLSQRSPESSSPSHSHPPLFLNTQTSSPHSPQNSASESDCNNSTPEPNTSKDEYTLVVKRSLRRKVKPVENSVASEDHNNRTQNNELDNHESTTYTNHISAIENTSSSDVMTFGSPNSDVDTDNDDPPPLPPSEPIYEVIETDGSVSDSTIVDSASLTPSILDVDENEPNPQKLLCNEDKFDHLIQALEEERKNIQNRPSTSSISDLMADDNMDENETNMKCNESQNQISDDKASTSNGITTTTVSISSNSDTAVVIPPSRLSVTLISDEITPCKLAISPVSIKTISVSEHNNNHDDGLTPPALPTSPVPSCQSPELPIVEVHKPGMTEEELREAIDGLKQKKSHLKRKRLAVHDKRQRVSSDEERLACEKEFASLERAVENTDNDIGFLQNQLDALCGHSLEAIKINNKKKAGSGKKKKSKKKAH